MKRTAASPPLPPDAGAGRRRLTRASTRLKKQVKDRRELETIRTEHFMSSPLLTALPLVLSSGYLYQYECMDAAATCQNWYHVWKDIEEVFPQGSKVQMFVAGYDEPSFVHKSSLIQHIHTPEFAHHIFDQVSDFKLASKKGNAARRKFLQRLPVWGLDIISVLVIYWGPNNYNNGGACFDYYGRRGKRLGHVVLHPDLTLKSGIRNRSVYDGTPLWP